MLFKIRLSCKKSSRVYLNTEDCLYRYEVDYYVALDRMNALTHLEGAARLNWLLSVASWTLTTVGGDSDEFCSNSRASRILWDFFGGWEISDPGFGIVSF